MNFGRGGTTAYRRMCHSITCEAISECEKLQAAPGDPHARDKRRKGYELGRALQRDEPCGPPREHFFRDAGSNPCRLRRRCYSSRQRFTRRSGEYERAIWWRCARRCANTCMGIMRRGRARRRVRGSRARSPSMSARTLGATLWTTACTSTRRAAGCSRAPRLWRCRNLAALARLLARSHVHLPRLQPRGRSRRAPLYDPRRVRVWKSFERDIFRT